MWCPRGCCMYHVECSKSNIFVPACTWLLLVPQIVVWDEIQSTKGVNRAGTETDVTPEAAQFLLHRPKRQAVKVCARIPRTIVSTRVVHLSWKEKR